MAVKTTNFALQNASEVLNEVALQPIPVKTALNLKDIIRKVGEKLKDMEDLRQDYIKEAAELDEDGTPKTDPKDGKSVLFASDDSKKEFFEKVTELYNTEVELQINKIKPSELGNAEISVQQLFLLDFMIDED